MAQTMPHHYPLQTWYLSFGLICLIGFAEATTLGLGFRLFLKNANEAFECSWYLFDTLELLIAKSMKPEIDESWIVVKWKHPPWTLPSEPIPPQQNYAFSFNFDPAWFQFLMFLHVEFSLTLFPCPSGNNTERQTWWNIGPHGVPSGSPW